MLKTRTSPSTHTSFPRQTSIFHRWLSTALLPLLCLIPAVVSAQAGTGPGGVGDVTTSVDLTLWLKADVDTFSDITCTTPAADTDGVACWKDQSSQGNDAEQTLEIRQGSLRTNILNATNGKPVVRFDGADDFMLTSAVPATGADPRTLIAVINDGNDSGLAYQHILHYGKNGFADAYGICFRTNPNQTSGTGSNVGNHYWSTGFSSNQTQTSAPLILTMAYDGSEDELFANGFTQGTKTINLTTGSTDGIRLSSRVNTTEGEEHFDGDIAEVIAFGDILSVPERILIDNYLSSKYDIALTAGDQYDGDTLGNGDYDADVAGIGRDNSASHSSGASAGLFLNDTSFLLDDGDYLLAGHDTAQNAIATTDLPMEVEARMERVWYLDVTDASNNGGAVQVAFDFVLAGLDSLPSNGEDFHLLARAGTTGTFASIATSTDTLGDQIRFDLADVNLDLVDLGPYFTVGFVPDADLAITKDDGQTEAITGEDITYTITVTNSGTIAAIGATVNDTFPLEIENVTWTCTASPGSTCTTIGTGNIADIVTIDAGGTLTYTATGTLALSASGTVSNTATVSAPMGSTDPNLSDNTATDTDTVIKSADLSITKTDGETLIEDDVQIIYTIIAANAATSRDVTGATVSDNFPAPLTCNWTCAASAGAACTAGPVAGNINDTVDLPAGASVTYSATCDVPPGTLGILTNTATITIPMGIPESNPSNNQATDVTRMRNIFLNGFESGNTSAWSNSVGNALKIDFGGDLARFQAGVRLLGDRLLLDGEKTLLSGTTAAGDVLFRLIGRQTEQSLEWRLSALDASGFWYHSGWQSMPSSASRVELLWQAQSELDGGRAKIAVDGLPVFDLRGLTESSPLRQLMIHGDSDQPSALIWEDIQLE